MPNLSKRQNYTARGIRITVVLCFCHNRLKNYIIVVIAAVVATIEVVVTTEVVATTEAVISDCSSNSRISRNNRRANLYGKKGCATENERAGEISKTGGNRPF